MALPVLILLQLLWLAPPSSSESLSPSVLVPGCDQISYPFGVSGQGFNLTCDPKENGTVMLALRSTKLKVLNISLNGGYLRAVLEGFTWRCGRDTAEGNKRVLDLEGTPFTFSHTMSKFTLIGCDAMAILIASSSHTTSCVLFCTPASVIDGSCSGVGFCQASIPRGLKRFDLQFSSIRNMTHSLMFDNSLRCTKAFVLVTLYVAHVVG